MKIFQTEVKTADDKLEQQKDSIIAVNITGLKRMERYHDRNFNSIWNNRDYTPQEVLDTFGTDAQELFIASQATQTFIKAMDDSYEPLVPPYEFTVNEDGTVTVGDLIDNAEPVTEE